MHGLKDYYGMVRLLEEFPDVHQTFNLVPSLMDQIEDYAAGTARDPLLELAAKPAASLTTDERRMALANLFQANAMHLIGRYPRYHELFDRFRNTGANPEKAERSFSERAFTDLQVLSQLAWFDEYVLEEPEIAELVRKGRNYSLEDQAFVIAKEREIMSRILPAHAAAAKRGGIEISTSPYYHPILPLVCDTEQGAVSSPGLPLPRSRFRRPEDAREQIRRGLDRHEEIFGMRPYGMWPSEGSVSDEAVAIAHSAGIRWMATDEGVLARSLNYWFTRDGQGRLNPGGHERLYTIYQYEKADAEMKMIFRDHSMSDQVGFVYSGMNPNDAAGHLMHCIRQAAQPLLAQGQDAMIPIILDGENAWEYFPRSGREFLRRFYDALQSDGSIESVTVTEAISRQKGFAPLKGLVPGSWIHANFNVWVGAPEDNVSWEYLASARALYDELAPNVAEEQRKLAWEELLIAEGSDWNWWYGPEHSTANDRDFDELYRKHLSNVYQLLGATPPDYLAQPISLVPENIGHEPLTRYIHPRVDGKLSRYFEWVGAAHYVASQSGGAMHGKQFYLDCAYAGIDAANVYGRLDLVGGVLRLEEADDSAEIELVVNLEAWAVGTDQPHYTLRLGATLTGGRVGAWQLTDSADHLVAQGERESADKAGVRLAVAKCVEFGLPLHWLGVTERFDEARVPGQPTRVHVRFSLWKDRIPADALPLEGWIELPLVPEHDLIGVAKH